MSAVSHVARLTCWVAWSCIFVVKAQYIEFSRSCMGASILIPTLKLSLLYRAPFIRYKKLSLLRIGLLSSNSTPNRTTTGSAMGRWVHSLCSQELYEAVCRENRALHQWRHPQCNGMHVKFQGLKALTPPSGVSGCLKQPTVHVTLPLFRLTTSVRHSL